MIESEGERDGTDDEHICTQAWARDEMIAPLSTPDAQDAPNDSDAPDDVLVQRAQLDPDAFGLLYERYSGEIQRFILPRVSHDLPLAQDLTSQVFTKAFIALPHYQAGAFRGWLYAIARNVVIDNHRRTRPTATLDLAAQVPTQDEHLDDLAIAADASAKLHAALRQLKPEQREIVLLRLQGLTGAEIAQHLGMHPDAVKSAQYRAFAKLRTYLHELAPDRRETR